ncbi:hypothetical protein LIER_31703 [Lithospermum erythrorhizon]|uniref:Uncharacterized protein n=1 Tax=Lithospermum erythrorhizon TaxID=34254 RepID=A0AAV3RVB3_LITER
MYIDKEGIGALKGLALPLTQAKKIASTPLKGFVTPVQVLKIEHEMMSPKAYDLLAKVGYDPTKDVVMGKLPPDVTESKIHGLKRDPKDATMKRVLHRKLYSWTQIDSKATTPSHNQKGSQLPYSLGESRATFKDSNTEVNLLKGGSNSKAHEKNPEQTSLPKIGGNYQEVGSMKICLSKIRRSPRHNP